MPTRIPGITKRKGDAAVAIQKADGDNKCQQCKPRKMQVHPGPAPGLYAVEAVVAEMNLRCDIAVPNPVHSGVAQHFKQHDTAETDAKNRQ